MDPLDDERRRRRKALRLVALGFALVIPGLVLRGTFGAILCALAAPPLLWACVVSPDGD